MNRLRFLFVAALVIAAVVGTIVIVTAQENHEAMIQVMVKRSQLERANGASEDSKNRWVWVRDGLELKHHFISDDVLKRVIASAKIANTPSLARFRKSVNVHYSGGDDNLYTIRVKDSSAKQAVDLANAFIKEFAPLVVDTKINALTKSIRTIETETFSANDEAAKVRRSEILEILRGDLAFAKAEIENRIVIVSHAHEAKKIWPKPVFIYAASALLTMFFGSLIAVALRLIRS